MSIQPSLRAKRSNPAFLQQRKLDCFRLRSPSFGGLSARRSLRSKRRRVVASLLAMTAERPVPLNWLPRIRHRRGEAAVHRNRLAVDVTRLVACQKESHRRQLMRLARTFQRIELADLVLRAALLGAVEDRLGHAGLDQ